MSEKEPLLSRNLLWIILIVFLAYLMVAVHTGYANLWPIAFAALIFLVALRFRPAREALTKSLSALSVPSGSKYRRLVSWVETNTPARFDGSQPVEEVEQHLKTKFEEFKKQGWKEERLTGFKWFIESRMYDGLLKK